MDKQYNARRTTRVTISVDTGLHRLALLRRRGVSQLQDDVFDSALPSAQELAAQAARPASHGQDSGHAR